MPWYWEKMFIWCIVFFLSIQLQLHKIDKILSIQVHVCMKNTFLSLVFGYIENIKYFLPAEL